MGIGNWELGIGNWELGIGNKKKSTFMHVVKNFYCLLPPDLKETRGRTRRGDAERGIFMHGGEKIFHRDCLLPCSLLHPVPLLGGVRGGLCLLPPASSLRVNLTICQVWSFWHK
ncbi:MAG: hypothetical protein F6K47_18240 [Symploca sp. SIO2E6]|nr:hypothetical protein [Symploca sp. SIO2E6]